MTRYQEKALSRSDIKVLPRNKRVFFGHRSVGSNIINGIRSIAPSLAIFEVRGFSVGGPAPGFYHASIGQNGNPWSKFDAFAKYTMEGEAIFDIAMMKLCYVDIRRETDIVRLFHRYTSMISTIQDRFPNLRIIHFTVPLRSIRLGVRSRLRQLVGRPICAVEDNFRRHEYNELVRNLYSECGTLFDLAHLESMQSDGCTKYVRIGGRSVPVLRHEYSSDGGHLNVAGQQLIARELLKLIDEA